MKKFALGVIWVISLILAAAIATSLALKNQLTAFGIELANTQAMLAFNHMGRYKELEQTLLKAC